MADYDWSEFTLKIPVRASMQEIYARWTSQAGLESWFLRSSVIHAADGRQRTESEQVQQGDTYHWMWHGYPDDTLEKGEILETNGRDLLRFSFAHPCEVRVQLIPAGEEVLVELRQDHIPLDEKHKALFHLGCSQGWTFYLANLKSLLEGGIDLRNRRLDLTGVVSS